MKSRNRKTSYDRDREAVGMAPSLFGPEVAAVKKIADRAEAQSPITRAKAEAMAEAAAEVDLRKPAVIAAQDYITVTQTMIAAIMRPSDIPLAYERWAREEDLRQRAGLDLKQVRLLKASLDGRCNRVRDSGEFDGKHEGPAGGPAVRGAISDSAGVQETRNVKRRRVADAAKG